MLSIELYGFGNQQALGLDSMIYNLFKSKPYRDGYVIANIHSGVVDHQSVVQPFLRLVSTPNEHLEDIITELQKLNFDIGVMILERYIPKK